MEEKQGDDDRDPRAEANESSPQEPDRRGLNETAFVRFGLYFYGAMIAAALVWRMGIQGESILLSSAASADAANLRPLHDLGIGTLVGLFIVAVSHAMTKWTDWGEVLARELAEAIGPISVPNAILLAVASGLGEELFFRGALQPRVGLIVASLLFGAMHFVPRREMLPWTGFALVVGLLFGAVYEWTGSVIAPVVAHTVVNGVNLPYLLRRYGSDD